MKKVLVIALLTVLVISMLSLTVFGAKRFVRDGGGQLRTTTVTLPIGVCQTTLSPNGGEVNCPNQMITGVIGTQITYDKDGNIIPRSQADEDSITVTLILALVESLPPAEEYTGSVGGGGGGPSAACQ